MLLFYTIRACFHYFLYVFPKGRISGVKWNWANVIFRNHFSLNYQICQGDKSVKEEIFQNIFYTAIWVPLGQLWAIIMWNSLTHLILITAFYWSWTKCYLEPHWEPYWGLHVLQCKERLISSIRPPLLII